MPANLHPDLEPLGFLVGTWSGPGKGEYPTIEPFSYHETVTYSHIGRPFLAYSQRTADRANGRPLHAESGFLRVAGPSKVELVIAQPIGIVEILHGEIAGSALRLRSSSVGGTATAKEVTVVERDLELEGEVLRTSLRMAAVGQPLTHHLAAELRRTAG